MKGKAEQADRHLNQKDQSAENEEASRHRREKDRHQETDREGTARDGDPFRPVEEAILCMIGQTEDEVPDHASQTQQNHPPWPLLGLRIDHAVHNEQKAQTGVRQGRGKSAA